MELQSKKNDYHFGEYALKTPMANEIDYALKSFPGEEIITSYEKKDWYKNILQQFDLDALLTRLALHAGKRSFLVFKNNKYFTVPTENIAFFYVKYESSKIMCFDRQEYSVNYSLEQIQNLLTEKQFFRLNRQYLVNFNAVKEVEHYFARKLLVNLVIPVQDKLLISKEKISSFLHWLDNR